MLSPSGTKSKGGIFSSLIESSIIRGSVQSPATPGTDAEATQQKLTEELQEERGLKLLLFEQSYQAETIETLKQKLTSIVD